MRLNIITLVLALSAIGVVLVRNGWLHLSTPGQIVGLAIAVPALVLFVVARLQLGRAFSVQAKASVLVTEGLYSRIRNPIYVFGGLLIAGALIYVGNPWLFLIFVVLIPMQLLRVRKEEQVLEAKFGEAYREYKRKTWF